MAVFSHIFVLGMVLLVSACQSGRSANLLDIEKSDDDNDEMPWNEFSESPSVVKSQRLVMRDTRSGEKLNRSLSSLASLYHIERPKKFGAGVVGRHGDVVVYAANWSSLQYSEDRMYWDLVHVLSKRYGCLMRERKKSFQTYAFRCKDSRTVQLSYYKYPDHVVILGTQMDRYGRQLIVQR